MLQIFDGQKCECWWALVWMIDTMVNTCKFTPGFFQFSRQCFLLPQFLLFLAPLFSQRPSSNVIEIHLQYHNSARVKNCYNHCLHLTYEIGDLHTSSELFTLIKGHPDLNKLWWLKFYYYLLIQQLKQNHIEASEAKLYNCHIPVLQWHLVLVVLTPSHPQP